MRWEEIINEYSDSTSRIKNFTLDVLSTLKSQNHDYIAVNQLKDILQHNNDINGINITDDFIVSLVKGFPIVKEIKPNPNSKNQELTVYLKVATNGDSRTTDQAEKDKEKINKAAVKQIKQKQKQ